LAGLRRALGVLSSSSRPRTATRLLIKFDINRTRTNTMMKIMTNNVMRIGPESAKLFSISDFQIDHATDCKKSDEIKYNQPDEPDDKNRILRDVEVESRVGDKQANKRQDRQCG
jgi:hypothetical protein